MKPTQYMYMTDERTSILVYLSAQDQFEEDQVFSSGRGCTACLFRNCKDSNNYRVEDGRRPIGCNQNQAPCCWMCERASGCSATGDVPHEWWFSNPPLESQLLIAQVL
jgi:hypothetical protein